MGAARAARSKWSAAAASRPGRHVIRRTGDAGAAGAGDANSSVGRAGQGRGGRDGLVTFAGICRPNDTLERDPSPPQATRQVEAQAAAVASAGRRPDGAASDAPTSPSHDHLWATKPIPSPPQAQDVLGLHHQTRTRRPCLGGLLAGLVQAAAGSGRGRTGRYSMQPSVRRDFTRATKGSPQCIALLEIVLSFWRAVHPTSQAVDTVRARAWEPRADGAGRLPLSRLLRRWGAFPCRRRPLASGRPPRAECRLTPDKHGQLQEPLLSLAPCISVLQPPPRAAHVHHRLLPAVEVCPAPSAPSTRPPSEPRRSFSLGV